MEKIQKKLETLRELISSQTRYNSEHLDYVLMFLEITKMVGRRKISINSRKNEHLLRHHLREANKLWKLYSTSLWTMVDNKLKNNDFMEAVSIYQGRTGESIKDSRVAVFRRETEMQKDNWEKGLPNLEQKSRDYYYDWDRVTKDMNEIADSELVSYTHPTHIDGKGKIAYK